jgi:succinoglycan biosynthesis transport protein ExoP
MAIAPTPPADPNAAAPPPTSSPTPAPAAPSSAPSAASTIDPLRLLRVYWPWLAAAGVFSMFVGVALYVALGMFAPKFRSFAVYEVRAPHSLEEGAGSIGRGGRDELETYMETQANVITSDRVLSAAVIQPEVEQQTKWSRQFRSGGAYNNVEALKELRDVVSAGVIPETNLIRMSVIVGNPRDAAIIASAVSDVFMRDNLRATTADAQSNVEDFQTQLRELRQDVSALDVQIENLIAEKKLTSDTEETSIYYSEVQNLNLTLVDVRAALAGAQEQLTQFTNIRDSPSGVVYPEGIRADVEAGPIAQQLESEIETAEAYLQSAREQFGANHRSVRRQEATIRALAEQRQKVIQREMAELFNTTIEGLGRQVASLRNQEDELMGRIEEAQTKLNDITAALKLRRNMQADREQKLEHITFLETQISEHELIMRRGSRVRVLSPPEEPDIRSFPTKIPVIGGTMVVLTGLVGGLIFLKEIREQRIRTPQDIALIPRTRVLGVIPDIALDPAAPDRVETASLDRPAGAFAETLRQLRTSLLKAVRDHDHRAIVFAAGMPGSGTTSVISNLAVNAALIDLRVLVVDANLRRPNIHKIFEASQGPGLAEILRHGAQIDDVAQPTSLDNLTLIAAGTDREHAFERFNTRTMGEFIASARSRFDLILLDAPPTIVSGDALAIASQVDASVCVCRAYSENRGLVAKMRNQLTDARAEFLGVIVNAIRPSAGGYFKRNFQAQHDYQYNGQAPEAVAAAGAPAAGEPAADDEPGDAKG